MAKPYRNPMHGMARRRHTSSRHFQRRTSSSTCMLTLLIKAWFWALRRFG